MLLLVIFATERIINKTGIKSIHGKVFDYDGILVVPVIHPAGYLYSGRNPQMLQEMKDDFMIIASIAVSEKKQKNLFDF